MKLVGTLGDCLIFEQGDICYMYKEGYLFIEAKDVLKRKFWQIIADPGEYMSEIVDALKEALEESYKSSSHSEGSE